MSDDMNTSGEEQFAPVGELTPAPAEPIIKAEAVSRNALLFVAGAILLAATIGFVVYAMTIGNTPPVTQITSPSGPVTTPGGGGSTTTSEGLLPVAPVDDRDVFTPRNPFVVIDPIVIAVAPSADTTDPANNDDDDDNNSSTLQLLDITGTGDDRKAVVKLNGVTYTLEEGDTVGTSNWSIVEINATNIVALYGDEQVTISLADK